MMSVPSSSPSSSLNVNLPTPSVIAGPKTLLAPPQSNADDIEALHIQEEELKAAQAKAGVVVQHRSWELPGTLHSDDFLDQETPSKPPIFGRQQPAASEQTTRAGIMPFSSSPVLYPQSSSPPTVGQKRKLFQSWKPEVPRKRKMLGGFVVDEEDEEGSMIAEAARGAPATLNAHTEPPMLESNDSSAECQAISALSRSPSLPPLPQSDRQSQFRHNIPLQTSSGNFVNISLRPKSKQLSYEQMIAQRSVTAPGRAKKAYYGIDIHRLLDEHKNLLKQDVPGRESEQRDTLAKSFDQPIEISSNGNSSRHQMWTEKYRARKFTDLIGDERTHRSVLRWLKSWDSVVFPGCTKPMTRKRQPFADSQIHDERPQHRKILLLTGPPGLGKTTLAHVCARQAGYETLEINASDERSRDVVKGRIRDAVGTENVRGIDVMKGDKKTRKAGRPVCVVVDEVDGVVSGSSGGGGEGGFMKALVDLIQLDRRNTQSFGDPSFESKKTKKGDKFRLLRPIILVCNDLYAPALRPLRTSSCAEIIHVRRPPLEKAVSRLSSIFEKEGISSDADAVRRLCEASWGVGSRKQGHYSSGAGEGDIRGVLVQGEWIAHKLRSISDHTKIPRLTKTWIEEHILKSDSQSSRGLGRGGIREMIDRVFIEGAGLPNLPNKTSSEDAKQLAESKTAPIGVSELRKHAAVTSIREMVDTLGDHDRLMTDCFTTYPSQFYQDDTYLTKPVAAYDWLHFHDMLSSRVFGGQEWELNPYLSQSVCAFHHLFATANNEKRSWDADHGGSADKDPEAQSHPFSGPRADFAAYEAEKANRAIITEFQSSFSAPLLRLYRSTDAIAEELIPNVTRMLAPEVKPVVVGGSSSHGGQSSVASVRKESEKKCVRIGSRVMSGLDVKFEKVRVEIEGGGAHSRAGFAFRMEPPLDALSTFESTKPTSAPPAPVRYAVRHVLDQEYRRDLLRIRSESRFARASGPNRLDPDADVDNDKENANINHKKQQADTIARGKRDFFGRIVNEARPGSSAGKGMETAKEKAVRKGEQRVWVSFHEGYSNAVRKPIGLREFVDSF